MKNVIRSRVELLWAKIAGRSVDMKTLVPPVATNMTEKLMLETADRMDSVDTATQPFTVTVTCANNVYSSDKTFAEIKAAIDAGRRVEFINDSDAYGTLAGVSSTTVIFHTTDDLQGGSVPMLRTYEITESGVDYYAYQIVNNELPTVTAADNGSVLSVVDGAWGKAGGSTLVVNLTEEDQNVLLDRTWTEIHNALSAAKRCVIISEDDSAVEVIEIYTALYAAGSFGIGYYVDGMKFDGSTCVVLHFFADSADGYPVLSL